MENVDGWLTESGSPAVLLAYDAMDLSHELYNTNQALSGRDQFAKDNRFVTPMIANGTGGAAPLGIRGRFPMVNLGFRHVENARQLPTYSNWPTNSGFSHRQSAIFAAVNPPPTASVFFREVCEWAIFDVQQVDLPKQLGSGCPGETIAGSERR